MPNSIPDLWGDSINMADLAPVIILDQQAANIESRTNGIIVAEVIKRSTDLAVTLLFDIVSKTAQHRSRLVECHYLKDELYPIWVVAESLRPPSLAEPEYEDESDYGVYIPPPLKIDTNMREATRSAHDQATFCELLSEVFTSFWVKAKIRSMIANSSIGKYPLTHLVEEPLREKAKSG